MDTKVAGQVAKQMAQFFKVFKDVEEVLEAAAQVENLKGEVARQIENLVAERTKLEGEIREVKASLSAAKTQYAKAKEAQEAAGKAAAESLEAALKARQEKADAELAVTQEQQRKANEDHTAFVEAAAANRAELERNIAALQKTFAGLKSKVASL